MEIGVYHEFHCRPDQTSSEAFEEALAQIEAADRWGLDAIWLAEIHQQPRRSVLAAPLTVASAIAARTRRIKIGTGVQVLPLCHPLRLAEETATIDQISKGRLLFGVGRSGNPRSYVAYGVPYSESRERFLETLEIVKRAWAQPSFSYDGKYYSFNNAAAVLSKTVPADPGRRGERGDFPVARRSRISDIRRGAQRIAVGARAGPRRVPRCLQRRRPFR